MTKSEVAVGCLGEVMLELVTLGGATAQLGAAGDTYSKAVYLRHVASELTVDYITGIGTGGLSNRVLKHMTQFGVGEGRVFKHPDRGLGLYAIETAPDGERYFTYWRSASVARCPGDPDMPSIDDEQNLFGDRTEADVLRRFEGYGVAHGMLKRGADGPRGCDGPQIENRVQPVRVADTTAAGDSFNAKFLASVLQGRSILEAMTAGHALACRVIAEWGAIIFSKGEHV